MQMHIPLLALALFYVSQCQWAQTRRAKFCHKVLECAKDPIRQIPPSTDDYVLPENETKPTISTDNNLLPENMTKTICMHALLCTKPRDPACDKAYSVVAVPKWFDNIYTNKTDLCSILNACTNSSTIHKHDDAHFRYLQNLTQYCPNTDYCGLTDPSSVPNTESGMASCCVSCSCKPECGLHHECCFASLDYYNVIETEQMSCIALQTASFGMIDFYMLDKCPDGTECFKPDSTPQPVSSACTKRIYINKECARCNGIISASDFITWQMTVDIQAIEQLISHINTQTFYNAEYTIPSVHRMWIAHYVCGPYYENTCKHSLHKDQDLIDACDNVHAPIFTRGMKSSLLYSNAYCMMCSYGLDPRSYPCHFVDDPPGRHASFNMVLDMEILQAHTQKDPCADNDPDLQRQVGCRPVLCPEWMLRVDGKCYYVMKRWNGFTVSTQMTLKPNSPIPADLFYNMTKSDQFRVHTWLFNECKLNLNQSKQTINLRLYMLPVEMENGMVVKEFLLRMKHIYVKMEPSFLFGTFERCIKRRWTLTRGNINYYLSASLYSYKYFMPDGSTSRSHLRLNKSLVESPLPRIYTPITISSFAFYRGNDDDYVDLPFYDDDVIPTKLAFCERVELSPADVELLFGQIRVKNTGKVLGDSEFGAQYDRLDGEDRLMNVHVCLEDFVKSASSVRAYNVVQYIGVGIALFVASFVWKQ